MRGGAQLPGVMWPRLYNEWHYVHVSDVQHQVTHSSYYASDIFWCFVYFYTITSNTWRKCYQIYLYSHDLLVVLCKCTLNGNALTARTSLLLNVISIIGVLAMLWVSWNSNKRNRISWSRLGHTYMHQWTGSSLVQVMDCRLLDSITVTS